MSEKTMPAGQRGFCVLKRGEEHLRGDDDMHEWKTRELADGFLNAIVGVAGRFGTAENFSTYYVAGPDGEDVEEDDV